MLTFNLHQVTLVGLADAFAVRPLCLPDALAIRTVNLKNIIFGYAYGHSVYPLKKKEQG